MRVLKWIIERVEGCAGATETALGYVPAFENLDWRGAEFNATTFANITAVSKTEWSQELNLHHELLTKLAHHLPVTMTARYEGLRALV